MTPSLVRLGCRPRIADCALIGLLLLFAVSALRPQTVNSQSLSESDPIAGSGQKFSDQDPCSGPLAALLPECQPKASIQPPSIHSLASAAPAFAQAGESVSPTREGKTSMLPAAELQPIAPEAPSEFQRFAASSIGRILPVFGASLFERVPTTFAPLDRIPVTAEYVIGPGDEILLRVWGQVSLDLKLGVDRSGGVYIPQVGNVNVSGIQFKQLPDYLRSQLEKVFRNFDLSVNMGQLRSIQIFVMGHARRPATYTVSSLSTLVNALFASGGPSAQGSMRRIQLRRGANLAAEIDLYDLLLRGDKSGDIRLTPEDVIFIPPVGAQVAASGSLKNPAIYELKNEKTVGELIQMAGGLAATADRKRARIERIKDGVSREVLNLSLDPDSMGMALADGDVFQALAIAPRFENAVTLRGNVANPGRFVWRDGMRLRDIIPDKESLITRDYWKKRNLLGYTPEEQAIPAAPAAEAARQPAETRVAFAIPDINWSYAVIERQDPGDLSAELIPFNPGKLILEKDERQNLKLQSGDVVTIFSQADIRVPQFQQTRFVRLEGEFLAPGIYSVSPGETLDEIVQKAGGLTPQAYLFGSEFLRESTRRDQQQRMDRYIQDLQQEVEKAAPERLANAGSDESAKLAQEIQSQRQLLRQLSAIKATGRIVLNMTPDSSDLSMIAHLPLEDGDRFIVPSRPATVNVLGAVYNPNAFLFGEKSQVRDYIKKAGGPTRHADEDRVYIVRADGSVLPKHQTSRFSKTRLNPGDSIVMPEQLFKTTFMMGLRNWSQVISQFGLGAAAINVLR